MAEPESILQLGIEAARDGNKEQARGLFRLLTRQEPDNPQAWLWLAGVAENHEERRAALERVVDLEPGNEMAKKGLQALGGRSTSRLPPEPEPPAPPPPPVDDQAMLRNRYDVDDDDPFAALDTLSEAMSAAPTAVRRTEPTPGADDDHTSATAAGIPVTPVGGDPRRPGRRPPAPGEVSIEDDDDTVPARRGVSPLLLGLIGLMLILLLAFLVWQLLFSGGNEQIVAPPSEQTAIAAATQQAATQQTQPAADATAAAGGALGGVDATPEPETPTDPAAGPTPATQEPTAGQPPAPDPAAANPAIVPPNTPLESDGWLYDFQRPTYAAPIVGNLGNFQPQGRFVVVLALVANRTGQSQPIPPDFFVLKDAQGRVYTARPDVSTAYVIPGVNADLNHTQAVPGNGLTTSVALIFDVAPDATNLVFFARNNPDQGWLVLQSV